MRGLETDKFLYFYTHSKKKKKDCSYKLSIFLAAKQDLRASGCLYVSIGFFAIFSKIFRQPIPENLWPYAIFFCWWPYEKKIVLPPVQHFRDIQYKIFFCFNHTFFLEIWDPPTNQIKIFTKRCWVSK